MEITFKKVFEVLFKYLVIILVISLLCLSAAYAYSKYVMSPSYTSTVKFNVNVDVIGDTYNDYTLAQKSVTDCIEFLNVNDFYSQVADASDLNLSIDQVRGMLSFDAIASSTFFRATVRSSSADTSKKIADVIYDLVPKRIASYKGTDYVKPVQGANKAKSPTSPDIGLNSLIGFVGGFLLSFVAFFIKELVDDRIKDVSELADRYDYPVLGTIPNFSSATESGRKKRRRS